MNIRLMRIFNLFLFIIVLFLISCSHIPQEAPELSIELGIKISELEHTHLLLLKDYFNLRKAEIETYVYEKWLEYYAEEVFDQTDMKILWSEIVRTRDKDERNAFLLKLMPKLQEEIKDEKTELLAPLLELENIVTRKIRDNYHQTRAINNSLTSFLIRKKDIKSDKARYIEMVNSKNDETAKLMNQITETVKILSGQAVHNPDKMKLADKYKTKINEILIEQTK